MKDCKCPLCKYEWKYKGKAYIAPCPRCHYGIRFDEYYKVRGHEIPKEDNEAK